MRLLVVTNDFPPRAGGIESFVLEVTRRVGAALGEGAVVVHTARQAGSHEADAELGAAGIRVVRDPSPIMLPLPAITRRVVASARRHRADAVWFGAAAPLGLMAPALRATGVARMVATTAGHEVWWASVPGTRDALRRIGEGVDVVTYLGERMRSRIAPALSPAARERMVWLHAGVDTEAFSPRVSVARARLGLADRPVVVCVSRMVPRKGQDVLVQALPAIRSRVPGTALLLVGDGPYRPVVQRLARLHGVEADVVVTGRVPFAELPDHYAAGDVFCMPSRDRRRGLETEGLGICYLEAAACGLPVVAGDSGGAPDAVLEGVSGMVVPGGSVPAVVDAVSALLLDADQRAAWGARGRAWVVQEWRWETATSTLLGLLANR